MQMKIIKQLKKIKLYDDYEKLSNELNKTLESATETINKVINKDGVEEKLEISE